MSARDKRRTASTVGTLTSGLLVQVNAAAMTRSRTSAGIVGWIMVAFLLAKLTGNIQVGAGTLDD